MTAVRKRVLVSESNDALRSMLATALLHENLDVDTTSHAAATLERLTSCDYAILLICLDDHCEDVLQRYHDLRPGSTTFVIGLADGREVDLGPDLVHAKIEKPFEIGFIAQLVRDCAAVVQLPPDPLHCPPPENIQTGSFDDTGGYGTN